MDVHEQALAEQTVAPFRSDGGKGQPRRKWGNVSHDNTAVVDRHVGKVQFELSNVFFGLFLLQNLKQPSSCFLSVRVSGRGCLL
jgi:hypothetical protein